MPSRGGEKFSEGRAVHPLSVSDTGVTRAGFLRGAQNLPSLGLCPGLLGIFKSPQILRV